MPNPDNPNLVSTVSGPGTDIKVWKQFVYSVTGFPNLTGQNEGRILDMSNPASPSTTGSFPSAHNSFIDDRGFLYLAGPGLRIMDLNENPRQPNQVWSNPHPEGHDITVIGNRLFEFQGNGRTDIYDITNPASPQLLGAINCLIGGQVSRGVSEQ